MLRRIAAIPRFAHLVPFLHAMSACPSDIFVGHLFERLFPGLPRGDSSEGAVQGRALSGLLFALVIHEELKTLNAELEPFKGCANAFMDDTYLAGPPREAFAAARRFAARIKEVADLDIQWDKVACYSPKHQFDDGYLRNCIWREGVPLGSVIDEQGNNCFGIDVLGIPIGDDDYIDTFVKRKAREVVSYIEKTVDTFHTELLSRHALWATLYYCCQTRFDYFLRHLSPEYTRPWCHIIQSALTKAVDSLGYQNMVEGDRITVKRLHLPVRQGGCGIRDLFHLAAAAVMSSDLNCHRQRCQLRLSLSRMTRCRKSYTWGS